MIDMNENHKNIEKEELTNIIKKLDIKKACGEDKITNKMIKLTYNGTKDFLFKLFNSSLYHGYYRKKFKKSQTLMLPKPGKPKSEITLAITPPAQSYKLSGSNTRDNYIQIGLNTGVTKKNNNNKTVLEVKEVQTTIYSNYITQLLK